MAPASAGLTRSAARYSAPEMKSNLALVFDFETDLAAIGPARVKTIGLLGIAIGVPAAVLGAAASLWLVKWTGAVSKLSMGPACIGFVLLANGLYRLIVGFIPIVARVSALRMLVMLVLLCALAGGAGFVLLAE